MKAALVDMDDGVLATKRHRIATPAAGDPVSMAPVFDELRAHFDYAGPIGCTFPGVVQSGVVLTAANLDNSWVGVDAEALFGTEASPVTVINDADAAGMAEIAFGAGRGVDGTVVMVTIGTGLGTAVFIDGQLVPNTEFGHIEIDGVDAETQASSRVIDTDGLSFEEWAPRFQTYLRRLEDLLWPNLFILGGGVSKNFDEWGPLVEVRTPAKPAEGRNGAGIIGAAMAAASGL